VREDPMEKRILVGGEPLGEVIRGRFDPLFDSGELNFRKYNVIADDVTQRAMYHMSLVRAAMALGQFLTSKEPNETLSDVLDQAIEDLSMRADSERTNPRMPGDVNARSVATFLLAQEMLEGLRGAELTLAPKPKGHIYTVEIPEDDTMLHWEQRLSTQPKPVRDALMAAGLISADSNEVFLAAGAPLKNPMGNEFYGALVRMIEEEVPDLLDPQLQQLMEQHDNAEEVASRYLALMGINGLKYADEQSRNAKNRHIVQNFAADGHSINSFTFNTKAAAKKYLASEEYKEQAKQFGYARSETRFIPAKQKTFNYVIFDDALIKILDLEQAQSSDAPRGRIRFSEEGISIDLLENADLSTFIHETGHFYTEVLQQLAPKSPSVKRDLDILRAWVGAAEGAELNRDQHEQIARGFEAYLMEGRAPTPALAGTFARMKAWMLLVYRSVKALNVELTDEVRGVFDRLVASEEEIAEAQKGLTPLFANPEELGMSDERAAEYRKAIEAARQAARDELEQKALADVKRTHTAAWKAARAKVRTEVAAQVNDDPMWRALSILQRHKLPDGTELPEGFPEIKLNRDAIVAMYDGDAGVLKSLPRPYVYSKDGIHPDQAAELLGFESGAALLKALPGPSEETAQARVERLTDERMKAEYGDLLSSGKMAEEASRAVHNVDRSRLLRLELEHLASNRIGVTKDLIRRITRRIPSSDAVRIEAERFIGLKANRAIKPHEYLAGEQKSAKKAQELLLKGDIDGAFREKLNELVNHERYRAASKAVQENESWTKYLKRFQDNKTRARFGKVGGPYLAQIDALLERFEFTPISLNTKEKRESLATFSAKNPTVNIPEHLLDESRRVNYLDITHEELRDVRDTVVQLAHLVRLKEKLLRAQKIRDRTEAALAVAGAIVANAKRTLPQSIETRLPSVERGRFKQEWFYGHRKYASLWREMAGFEEGSIIWELMVRPINEAANEEAVENERATIELDRLFGAYTAAEKRAMYEPQTVAGTSITMSKMGRLMVALNWGNEINRKRLISGYAAKGYTEKTFQAVIDSLDERDWQFVQGMWDYIGTYWPRLEQLGTDLNGLPPKKVEATPILTRFGEVRGGYFPIAYDDRQSSMAWEKAAKQMAERIMRGAAVRATTEKGMLEERVEGDVRGELKLDFGVIFGHVSEVIHTITHTAVLSDVQSILSHEAVHDAVNAHYGDVAYKEFSSTLNDIAAGDIPSQNGLEKGLAWLRQGATIVGLGYSFTTSLLQPFGVANSVARIGFRWVGVGISSWLKNPLHTVELVHGKSNFMRLRHKTMMREINEIQNRLGGEGKVAHWTDAALEKVSGDRVTRQGIANSFFWMIGRAQMVADIPTWVGAYEKALEEQTDEATAIARADQAVLDSQGGGQIKDLAKYQRGAPLLKLFTNF
jgi:hypothetical protein